MSDPLVPVITRAGLNALARAQGNGLQAIISQVAIGKGRNAAGTFIGYTPDKAATALATEMLRVPILSGARLDAPYSGFRILARVPATALPVDYFIREVGFYLDDGTLFALWSTPAFPLAYRTGLADVDFAFDLFLEQLPIGSLTLVVEEPDVPETVGVLAGLVACAARQFIASSQADRRAFARGDF